jgi:hypothetical protein
MNTVDSLQDENLHIMHNKRSLVGGFTAVK